VHVCRARQGSSGVQPHHPDCGPRATLQRLKVRLLHAERASFALVTHSRLTLHPESWCCSRVAPTQERGQSQPDRPAVWPRFCTARALRCVRTSTRYARSAPGRSHCGALHARSLLSCAAHLRFAGCCLRRHHARRHRSASCSPTCSALTVATFSIATLDGTMRDGIMCDGFSVARSTYAGAHRPRP
jgi:hypothetical protein